MTTFTPPTLEHSGSVSVSALAGRHAGETAWIVGKGPSLERIRASDFGPGPVLTLNQAIVPVQQLGLPQQIYALQLDGCDIRDEAGNRPCGSCAPLGWRREPLTNPYPGIATVFVRGFSSWCLHGRGNRFVIDQEFYAEPSTPSTLQAIALAKLMGCTRIVIVACDSLTSGTTETLYSGDDPDALAILQTNLAWTLPRVLDALANIPHEYLTP